MRRRRFLQASGAVWLAAVAGCLGSSSPPPRKSNSITDVELVADDATPTLEVALADDPWVMSRYDAGGSSARSAPNGLGGLLPVGTAGAQKGGGGAAGRGATGRGNGGYSSAPRTHHGFAWYHGGSYADDWYENHRDEVDRYQTTVATLGVAYLGSNDRYTDDPPGPGPVPWDRTIEDPEDTETYAVEREGWYRIGAELRGENVSHDFEWECVDLHLEEGFTTDGMEIDEEWKVSPRV
jgi:hypothetical protein